MNNERLRLLHLRQIIHIIVGGILDKDKDRDISLNIGVEQLLWGEGYERVAGVDEVGRGAWAGPITAAAAILPQHIILDGVKDSKKLTPKKREALAKVIHEWGETYTWACPARYIDEKGIDAANCIAMVSAIRGLDPVPNAVLIDGVHMGGLVNKNSLIKACNIVVRAYNKGESKSQAIAAASIIAKVSRDTLMLRLHERYPQYGFARHRGYGTDEHRQAIIKHGFCPAHRKAFRIRGLEYLYE